VLWFDEKTGIKTSSYQKYDAQLKLWFDEKTGIKTSCLYTRFFPLLLWFDEKTGIKTSSKPNYNHASGCGLMKKRE